VTHNSAVHALRNLLESDKVHQLSPTERRAIQHAIEQLQRLKGLEH
jgi:hypothetical protein